LLQVCSWGGGSRGQLGHGSLSGEEKPRLISALDGLRVRKIAAGGWHSAVISYADDLYMFGWNESGQLAQTTNLANKPAECFTAVEKLLMACCTMQPEDTPQPRGDSEDCEVGAVTCLCILKQRFEIWRLNGGTIM
jgi:alpha-tubulin suppressor-like RCC1 family protein